MAKDKYLYTIDTESREKLPKIGGFSKHDLSGTGGMVQASTLLHPHDPNYILSVYCVHSISNFYSLGTLGKMGDHCVEWGVSVIKSSGYSEILTFHIKSGIKILILGWDNKHFYVKTYDAHLTRTSDITDTNDSNDDLFIIPLSGL